MVQAGAKRWRYFFYSLFFLTLIYIMYFQNIFRTEFFGVYEFKWQYSVHSFMAIDVSLH